MKSNLSPLMKQAIKKLREFQGDSFVIESYTERVGRRFGGKYVMRRHVCSMGLSEISGVTMMALLDRGWLQVVEVENRHEPIVPWIKKTHINRYKFVDIELKKGVSNV